MKNDYEEFLERRRQLDGNFGFEPNFLPESLFDFQKELVSWALRKGRAAVFADCGMGKSPMELVCAENVVRETEGAVLLLTPLAVGPQMVAEAIKFGIEVQLDGPAPKRGILVTNYEKLHHYKSDDFVGVVCDESSILKNFDGATKAAVTEFMRRHKYRFLFSATAAPNDFVELGTSSEALGYLGHMDMLSKFFRNTRNTSDNKRVWALQGNGTPQWMFKGHAEGPFWRWVCSWARAARKPSDVGPFDDSRFVLPKLIERETVIPSSREDRLENVDVEARGLAEARAERKRSIQERCEAAASLVAYTGKPAVCWVTLNAEGDLLQKLIPGAEQISGKDNDEERARKLLAFTRGDLRVLVTKPSIGAFGLNWQHCAHATMFADYSFEQYYQAIRRFWRFGQTQDVVIDHVRTLGEGAVLQSRKTKAAKAEKMFSMLVELMRDGLNIERDKYGTKEEEVPQWLVSTK